MQEVTIVDESDFESSIIVPSSMLAGLGGGGIDHNGISSRGATNGLLELGRQLLTSAELGETDEVRQLMSRGAPFTTDWLGTSPLHAAATNGHLETCEVLLRAGISRDARTKVDRTPLHAAAQEGHETIVQLLLESGADADARDMLRMTPLHWAVEREHVECVRLLLQHGADPGLVSKFGKTAFSIALDASRHDILDMLKTTAATAAAATATQSLSVVMGQVPVVTHQEEVITSADFDVDETNILCSEEPKTKSAEVFVQAVSETSPTVTTTMQRPTVTVADSHVEEVVVKEETVADGSDSSSSTGMLRLLQAHGITLLPADNSSLVASAVRSGQSVVLTEAGKLALNQTLQPLGTQKVITLRKAPLVVSSMPRRGRPTVAFSRIRHQTPNILKRPVATATTGQVDSATSAELATITRQLEEARREAQAYRLLLSKKEREAERYRQQLQSITQQSQ